MDLDTQAIDTIAEILNTGEDWDADHLDAIAAVLDAVRDREGSEWKTTGPTLVWRNRRYEPKED